MRTFRVPFALVILILGLLVVPLVPALAADRYKVDGDHSFVNFRIKHLGLSWADGRFNALSGRFDLDVADPSKCSVSVEVRATSVDTNNAKRDQHLRGPDFFNARQFPVIRFVSTSVESAGGGVWTLNGKLTLRGVTKPITATLDLVGEGKDPWGGYRAGATAAFSIKRSEFGMTYMLDGLSDEVELVVSLEGVRS